MSDRVRILRIAAVCLISLFLVLAVQTLAQAQVGEATPVAQEDSPYQPPTIEANTPPWLEPFDPLAQLPVWSQAALLSASVAAGVFVVPTAGRWLWRTLQRGRFGREAEE